jgi:hypothetical protein
MKYLVMVCFLLFLFCINVKGQTTVEDNGSLWAVMSDTEKSFYVKGFKDGDINNFGSEARFYISILYPFIFSPFYVENKKKLEQLKKLVEEKQSQHISETTIQVFEDYQIIKQMNLFYKEPQNKKIGLKDMLLISIDKLKGLDITERLLDRRKYSEDPKAYYKELMENFYKKAKK